METKVYTLEVIISPEDAPRLLLKHGFVKDKRMWILGNDDSCRFSTQDALQALVLMFASEGLEGKPFKEKVPVYFDKDKDKNKIWKNTVQWGDEELDIKTLKNVKTKSSA